MAFVEYPYRPESDDSADPLLTVMYVWRYSSKYCF